MTARPGKYLTRFAMAGAARLLVLPMLGVGADPAFSQAVPAQPSLGLQEQGSQQATPAPEGPAGRENPGLINEMGKLFDKIVPRLKSPGETMHDAGEALTKFATPSSMVSGRMICPPSADGTPDCKSGANKLCQSKGYKEGKSLNTDSAETCSAKVLIPGRARKPDDCRTDNYVTRAICQ